MRKGNVECRAAHANYRTMSGNANLKQQTGKEQLKNVVSKFTQSM